jgi:hypothetical protein
VHNARIPFAETPTVDLKVPIAIIDELTDEVIQSTGMLDLASGEIARIEYTGWDVAARGMPWEGEDYEFTSGVLSNNGRDVEFKVDVNQVTGQYSVSATELLEIKVRAAQLFAGLSGKDLALRSNAEPKPAPSPPAAPGPKEAKRGSRGRYH